MKEVSARGASLNVASYRLVSSNTADVVWDPSFMPVLGKLHFFTPSHITSRASIFPLPSSFFPLPLPRSCTIVKALMEEGGRW